MTVNAKTLWLDAPCVLTFKDAVLNAPARCEILCETIVSVISPGTELSAFRGMPHLRPGVEYPRLLGYCNVARVIAVGEGVDGVSIGDRVLTHQSHRSHFLIPSGEALFVLDAAMDAAETACAYLFHLGYEAVLSSTVRPGSKVLVIGMGALGLTSVAAASLAGAEVVGLSDYPEGGKRSRAMGASQIVSRAMLEAGDFCWSGTGADVVIVTTNSWKDWDLALRHAGQRGTIACLGFPGRGEAVPETNPLASEHFYVKQLEIRAVGHAPQRRDSRGFSRFNERDNLAFLARMIAAKRLRADMLISQNYPAARVADAYDALLSRQGAPVTFALDWQS